MKIKVGISNRHIHLSDEDYVKLFGNESCGIFKSIVQPGQYATVALLHVLLPNGKHFPVRLMGPNRNYSQIELSLSDCQNFRIKNFECRMSGDIEGVPKLIVTTNPKDENAPRIEVPFIIALRHLHLSPKDAKELNFKDGDKTSIKVNGIRSGIIDNIIVRTGINHATELHLDTDEGNAFNLTSNDYIEL